MTGLRAFYQKEINTGSSSSSLIEIKKARPGAPIEKFNLTRLFFL